MLILSRFDARSGQYRIAWWSSIASTSVVLTGEKRVEKEYGKDEEKLVSVQMWAIGFRWDFFLLFGLN